MLWVTMAAVLLPGEAKQAKGRLKFLKMYNTEPSDGGCVDSRLAMMSHSEWPQGASNLGYWERWGGWSVCGCAVVGSTYLWHWVAQCDCAGPPGHCWPHRSSSQHALSSEAGWRKHPLQRDLSCSRGWHPHDKIGTGSGESLSGPHSEAPPRLPPQPGPWEPWAWEQGEILGLKGKTS